MRRWVVASVALTLLVAVWTVTRVDEAGRDEPEAPMVAGVDRAGARQLLSELSRAARTGATVSSDPWVDFVAANVNELDVATFRARYLGDAGATDRRGTWDAAVDIDYRLADERTVSVEATATFGRSGGALVLQGISGPHVPIWLTNRVTVSVKGPVVVIADEDGDTARTLPRIARRAVSQVNRVLPEWSGTLVVESPAPGTLEETLGQTSGSYDNVAAVAATTDGSSSATAPVHVYLNETVFGTLSHQGQQVVVTHEATHVATGAAADDLPLWLAEGFADYVALRDVDLPLGTTAGQILDLVRKQGPPDHLPDAADFDSSSPDFGAQYEAGWLACDLIVGIGGEAALVDLYGRVSAGEPVDAALRSVLGLSRVEFVDRWSGHLEQLALGRLAQS